MTYRGKVENGGVVLERPLPLPDGTIVDVEVEPIVTNVAPANDQSILPLSERYKSFIGIGKGLPPDASANHDHYLYGLPKGLDEK